MPYPDIITVQGLVALTEVLLPGAVLIEEVRAAQLAPVGEHTELPHLGLRLIPDRLHLREEVPITEDQQGPVVREVQDIEVRAEVLREVQDTEVQEVVPGVQVVSVVPEAHSDLLVVADPVAVAVPEVVEEDNNSIIIILFKI